MVSERHLSKETGLSDGASVFFFRIRLVYKFKLTVNGDADEPHDVGYAYDYCAAQCPRNRKILQ